MAEPPRADPARRARAFPPMPSIPEKSRSTARHPGVGCSPMMDDVVFCDIRCFSQMRIDYMWIRCADHAPKKANGDGPELLAYEGSTIQACQFLGSWSLRALGMLVHYSTELLLHVLYTGIWWGFTSDDDMIYPLAMARVAKLSVDRAVDSRAHCE